MRNGSRRNVIEIQRLIPFGFHGINQANHVWQTWREIFAHVEVRRGKEFLSGNQRISETVWRFTVRYEEVVGLTADMRILHDDMVFDIKSPLPDGQFNRDCVIECTVQSGAVGGAALMLSLETMIPDARVGSEMEIAPTISGGKEPYSVVVWDGALPPGLALNSATGKVSGTPSRAGEYSFVLRVEDAQGDTADLPQIELDIN